ncbi:MAG: HNH endonuclease [Acidobacteriia bacterium]|nr:HNH endonuclease [Terriglobia bacterium]MYC68945.1 HNH endonuclease [Terriglobia bacterium]
MGVKIVVAVTDGDWFEMLRQHPGLTEVNFWSPRPKTFRALERGELFLFKLHSPRNYIVGGGIFAYSNTLPSSLAWETFGEANGAHSLRQMRERIVRYRRDVSDPRSDFTIGCRILLQPVFFPESEWIPVPPSWAPNIVSLKRYDTEESEGRRLWESVTDRIGRQEVIDQRTPSGGYGKPQLIRPRRGQGEFRLLVTDIYGRRCAVTNERTLPALEAAHIRPFSDGGEHKPQNGLLLRRDIHRLFDTGYVTISPDLNFEVSPRIREEFENGRDYYSLHGKRIATPHRPDLRPDPAALNWHNEHCFF